MGTPIETDVVHHAMRPTLLKMGDYRNLNLTVVKHLAALSRLFPNTFNDKLCEQLFAHLCKWMETAKSKSAAANHGTSVVNAASSLVDSKEQGRELELCAAILEIF